MTNFDLLAKIISFLQFYSRPWPWAVYNLRSTVKISANGYSLLSKSNSWATG